MKHWPRRANLQTAKQYAQITQIPQIKNYVNR